MFLIIKFSLVDKASRQNRNKETNPSNREKSPHTNQPNYLCFINYLALIKLFLHTKKDNVKATAKHIMPNNYKLKANPRSNITVTACNNFIKSSNHCQNFHKDNSNQDS